MDDNKLLLTVVEVSDRTGWGRSFIYKILATGELRSIALGRTRRILVSDLQAYVTRLAEQADSPEAEAR